MRGRGKEERITWIHPSNTVVMTNCDECNKESKTPSSRFEKKEKNTNIPWYFLYIPKTTVDHRKQEASKDAELTQTVKVSDLMNVYYFLFT